VLRSILTAAAAERRHVRVGRCGWSQAICIDHVLAEATCAPLLPNKKPVCRRYHAGNLATAPNTAKLCAAERVPGMLMLGASASMGV